MESETERKKEKQNSLPHNRKDLVWKIFASNINENRHVRPKLINENFMKLSSMHCDFLDNSLSLSEIKNVVWRFGNDNAIEHMVLLIIS